MTKFLVVFLLFFGAADVQTAPADDELQEIIVELDLTLDYFFELLDGQDLETYIAGVRHAARARLLLEQYLGEYIDNYAYNEPDRQTYRLRLMASRAQALSDEAGRELWRNPRHTESLLRLSELEVMVKSLKSTHNTKSRNVR
ncbi:MAG: hypothetical protein AAF564_03195 [Bacteroidota bacterium]